MKFGSDVYIFETLFDVLKPVQPQFFMSRLSKCNRSELEMYFDALVLLWEGSDFFGSYVVAFDWVCHISDHV